MNTNTTITELEFRKDEYHPDRLIAFWGHIPVFPDKYSSFQPQPGEVWRVEVREHFTRFGKLLHFAHLLEKLYEETFHVFYETDLYPDGLASYDPPTCYFRYDPAFYTALARYEEYKHMLVDFRDFVLDRKPEIKGKYLLDCECKQIGKKSFTVLRATIVNLIISQDDQERQAFHGMTKAEKIAIMEEFARRHHVSSISDFTGGWCELWHPSRDVYGPEAFAAYLEQEIAPKLSAIISKYHAQPVGRAIPDEYHPFFHDGEEW